MSKAVYRDGLDRHRAIFLFEVLCQFGKRLF